MATQERVEGRNVSMYPSDWAVVQQVAKDGGHDSMSGGLRYIIRRWQQLEGERLREVRVSRRRG